MDVRNPEGDNTIKLQYVFGIGGTALCVQLIFLHLGIVVTCEDHGYLGPWKDRRYCVYPWEDTHALEYCDGSFN